MFSVEIRVNGQLIKVVTGLNKGRLTDAPHMTEYEIHTYDLESKDVHWNNILHRPSNGIEYLIASALSPD